MSDGALIQEAWEDSERSEFAEGLACERCSAEHENYCRRFGRPMPSPAELAELFPAKQIAKPQMCDGYTGPPRYIPYCENDATMALIAGWNPVPIESDEGKRRLDAMRAVNQEPR